jgi:hypothetical protein
VNYLNALEAGKSQWDESSRNDTRPFWNIHFYDMLPSINQILKQLPGLCCKLQIN